MPLGVHVAERAGVVGVLFLLLLRARPPRPPSQHAAGLNLGNWGTGDWGLGIGIVVE